MEEYSLSGSIDEVLKQSMGIGDTYEDPRLKAIVRTKLEEAKLFQLEHERVKEKKRMEESNRDVEVS